MDAPPPRPSELFSAALTAHRIPQRYLNHWNSKIYAIYCFFPGQNRCRSRTMCPAYEQPPGHINTGGSNGSCMYFFVPDFQMNAPKKSIICRYSGACKRVWGGGWCQRAGIPMLGSVVVLFFAVPIISRRDDYFWSAGSPNNPRWDCYKLILLDFHFCWLSTVQDLSCQTHDLAWS